MLLVACIHYFLPLYVIRMNPGSNCCMKPCNCSVKLQVNEWMSWHQFEWSNLSQLKVLASEWSNQRQENSISASMITYMDMIARYNTMKCQLKSCNVRNLTMYMLQNISKFQVSYFYEMHVSYCQWMLDTYWYVCSAQSGNLRNLKIALRILGIPRLCRQSRDCVTRVRNLEIETVRYWSAM